MPTITLNIPGGRIGSFFAGAAVASMIGGSAVAITENSYRYTSPQTGYYTIAPGDMHAADHIGANSFIIHDHALRYLNSDARRCFVAGVHLPQGAKLNSVTTFFRSYQTNFHTLVSFNRTGLVSGQVDFLVQREILDNTGDLKSENHEVTSGRVIRNDQYFYQYRICLSDHSTSEADEFNGARIRYEYSTAGD